MDKKIRNLIISAAVGCVIVAGCAAAAFTRSGQTLFRQSGTFDKFIEFQSESGTYLSAHLSDEHQTYEADSAASDSSEPAQAEYTVNINTATTHELAALLPGIGEKKAAAIVEYREIIGGFNSVEELIEIDGIGEKLLDQIRPYCVLEDKE